VTLAGVWLDLALAKELYWALDGLADEKYDVPALSSALGDAIEKAERLPWLRPRQGCDELL
jgi:hypothetical protein